MIPVTPVPEPSEFHTKARLSGQAWMAAHPDSKRPYDYWSPFRHLLAEGFEHRCGYTAMYVPQGTVDHLLSYKTHPELAYEWSNYRYAAPWINSSKGSARVLDPYEVEDGWFEILLPSLQLVLTDRVPAPHRALAEETLRRLPIAHDERIIKERRAWYELYRAGELSLDGLRRVAPLLARAVEKRALNQSETSEER